MSPEAVGPIWKKERKYVRTLVYSRDVRDGKGE